MDEETVELEGEVPQNAFEVEPRWVDEENPTSPRMSPKTVVDEMLAEQRDLRKKAMLTWDSRSEFRTTHGRVVPKDKAKKGGFDGRLPYIGPIHGYWVQNLKIYFGKIKLVELEEVPEKAVIKGETVYPRARVTTAMNVLRAAAMQSDPLLCRVCSNYRAKNNVDFTMHFAREHPDELQTLLDRTAEEETADTAPPATAKKVKTPLRKPAAG